MDNSFSQFSGLAVEIVEIIGSHLQPRDLLSVRLVCRDFASRTFRSFGRTFFTIVRADLTPESLERLRVISECKHLAFYPQVLHIGYQSGGCRREGKRMNRNAVADAANLLQHILIQWANVEKLVLEQKITRDRYDWILNLVTHAPKLQELSLQFLHPIKSLIGSLAQGHSCPALQKLTLKTACVEANTLCDFLSYRSETLRSLSFHNLNVGAAGSWKHMLTRLSRELPRLQSFSVKFISEGEPNRINMAMFNRCWKFPVRPDPPWSGDRGVQIHHDSRGELDTEHATQLEIEYCMRLGRIVGVSYSGPDMDILFKRLVKGADFFRAI